MRIKNIKRLDNVHLETKEGRKTRRKIRRSRLYDAHSKRRNKERLHDVHSKKKKKKKTASLRRSLKGKKHETTKSLFDGRMKGISAKRLEKEVQKKRQRTGTTGTFCD